MPKISPFLWFDNNAEEAMNFYLSIFKDGKVISVNRNGDQVMSVVFQLHNQEFMGLNAGPRFKFNESISFFVEVDSQAEVDELWTKLTAGGGEESMCGWLKDKFGLWWQIIPKALGQLLGDPDPNRARRATEAMLKMQKIDIATLQRAADQA